MPQLTQAEIRNNAIAFVHEWKDETRERAEAQTFWNEFLEIFGVKRRRFAVYEKAAKKAGGRHGAIDLFWSGVLLAEHKSRGHNLDKAALQAFEYMENLREDDAARPSSKKSIKRGAFIRPAGTRAMNAPRVVGI